MTGGRHGTPTPVALHFYPKARPATVGIGRGNRSINLHNFN